MPPKKATKKAASETATRVVNKRKTGGREPLKVWYMPYGNPFRVVAASAVKKLVLFLAVVCVGFYLRELVPIPEGVQDRVEQAVPPWLNSSMHMLNGLPALNASALNNGMPLGWRGPSPGQAALERGRRPKHPVVIVPGFISSGLELWDGLQCGKHFFRQRMWGTPAMATAYFANRQCWMQHMRLDPATGLDPPGIKLRAVSGLEAVDWFVPGYFVWGKVIESLGEVGYDTNMLQAAPYDWRLSPVGLEQRDGYFTRLKTTIETMVHLHKIPVALLAHSYGDQLVRYFLNWVEAPLSEGGGGGGKSWTDRHVAAYVDIAGPMLGIPKTVPSLLSGEMRDTAILGQLEGLLGLGVNPLDRFVSGTLGTVAATFRTWGSLWAMLPRGGVDIWGADDHLGAPDASNDESTGVTMDAPSSEREEHVELAREPEIGGALRHFLSIRVEEDGGADGKSGNNTPSPTADGTPPIATQDHAQKVQDHARNLTVTRNLTITESLDMLFERVASHHPRHAADFRRVTLGGDDAAGGQLGGLIDRILSIAGIGRPSGGSTRFIGPLKPASPAEKFGDPLTAPLPRAPNLKIYCLYGVGKPTERAYHYVHRPGQSDRPFALDVSVHGGGVERGVTSVDGDGSIPLVSLGYMCASGWRDEPRLNPAGAEVKIVEYNHRAIGLWGGGIQEGRFSGDHVNIMGNHEMIETVLEVVTGHGGDVEEKIYSGVREISDNVRRLRDARRMRGARGDEL